MILLKNAGYILTFDEEERELEGYDILIEDNIIKKIDKNITPPEGAKVIDASSHVVIPGLVNTHHHFYQTLTRALKGAQNAKLFDWLVFLYPIWANLDEEAVYYSTLLASAELLKTGTTLTSDHMYLYPAGFRGDIPSIQYEATEKIGIRAALTRGSMTRGQSKGGLPPDNVVQSPDEVLKHSIRTIEKFHDPSPLSMRRVILAPCSPFSVEKEVMIESAKIAREYKVLLHTHLAETQDEDQYCLETYGKRPLALMEELGWLGKDVYFAHGIWFNDDELKALKETGTGVSHCPSSNMRLGSGIARVREMIDMGIRVSLAVDGSASNDTSDMLGEARQAMLLQRVKYGPAGLSAREALKIATLGGAEMLGYDKLGRIKEGYGADIALFNLDHLQYAGCVEDPVSCLVFTGYNHETDYTIVNGKIVVEHGRLLTFDEEEIKEKANRAAKRLLEKSS